MQREYKSVSVIP